MFAISSRCRSLFCLNSLLHRASLSASAAPHQQNLASKLNTFTPCSKVQNELRTQRFTLALSRLLSTATDPKANIDQKRNERKVPSEKINQLKINEFPVEAPQFGEDKTTEAGSLKSQISNRVYTLPNLLCMFRIGLTPVVGYLIVRQNFDYALALCAISSVTDFFDGWIARNFNSESKLGALLDPLADKLLVATLTFTLTYVHLIPLWLTSLILTRDALIIVLGLYLRFRMLTPPRTLSRFFDMDSFKSERFQPTQISKVNTGFQLSLVLFSLASPLFPGFFTANQWFLQSLQAATGITTLWSGLYYLTRLK